MNDRIEAKKRIKKLLRTDFEYIYKEVNTGNNRIHLLFQMDSRSYSLQMQFDFSEKYCDILTFISPVVLTDEYYNETLYTINTINIYVKAFGRFYIDAHNDIVYSLRLPYSMIENRPLETLWEIQGAVKYFEDVFCILLDVAQGKRTFEDCKDFIEKMWEW